MQDSKYVRSLIEASLDPLVTISAEGKITDVNEASIKVTGISREELIDTDFSSYFTDPKKAQEGYLQVFEKGFVADYPLTIKHKNGDLTDVSYNASVYKDDKGNVLGVFAAARDVTDQIWAIEIRKANKELIFQNQEKEKRAAELIIANKELAFQNEEKEKRAAELIIANKELAFQNEEKEKRAAELIIANKELIFQNQEKEKRVAELIIADKELVTQTRETEILRMANIELEEVGNSLKIASQYSRSLIEVSLDPMITINIKGKITDLNEATVSITGITREKLIGSDFLNYFTQPHKAREVYQKIFAKGFVSDSPLTIRHENGHLTEVLFNGSVYRDNNENVQGAVVVARDVTETNRITKNLSEAMVFAEMATLIAEDAKIKAEKAAKTAQDAVKAKQIFLSNMSHEIRTPMNGIVGFTKVLLKTDLTSKQTEYLDAIKLSGDALIVLINDILDLAKVDSGKMIFEKIPFKMASSISAMLHLFEIKIQEKNIKLIKEYDNNIPEVLLGDPVRLHQIILNLISNAVKFTSKGEISVIARLISEDENNVTIKFSVADTGIGIPEDKLVTIFENFQQASSSTTRLYGGTGLGLAIVKQLVEAQGGSAEVQSEINKGSTFSIVLSFSKTNAKAELELEKIDLKGEMKGIKVLVVEDIPLNQLLMRTLLDDFGFEYDIADNGKIAIDKMKINTYDIVLMDLQMPIMGGFEATNYIRNTLYSKIPIIALTADVTTVDLAKCISVGMNDYIAKPVDERLLYSKIVSLVKGNSDTCKPKENIIDHIEKTKFTNLEYLNRRTKSNPILMMEMISLYLKQTPTLINEMKQGFKDEDWNSMYTAVHKLIPSFAIMGISTDFENMAKNIQEYATNQQQSKGIPDLILQIENACMHACSELEEEFNAIKNTKNE